MKNKLLEKTFQVLEAVAASPEPVSLKELSGRLGINSSTLSRIAADLVETGYLTKAGYRNFEPALGLIRIGQNAVHSSHLPRTVNPLVRMPGRRTWSERRFCGVESGQVVYLYRSDAFSDENRIGLPYRVPLYRSNIAIAILAMSLPSGEALERFRADIHARHAEHAAKADLAEIRDLLGACRPERLSVPPRAGGALEHHLSGRIRRSVLRRLLLRRPGRGAELRPPAVRVFAPGFPHPFETGHGVRRFRLALSDNPDILRQGQLF